MSAIDRIVAGRLHDLGGFEIRRLIPSVHCRHVGPFVFLDLIGPANFAPGAGVDVRPHPHIGLATVTYLFDGALHHRDSVGSDQIIRPGDVNWMTAGRGIAHSERSPEQERDRGHRLHGLQFWVGLPLVREEAAPSFQHVSVRELPQWRVGAATLRLVAGSAFGRSAPVEVASALHCVDLWLEPGADIELESEVGERALLLIEGDAQLDGEDLPASELALLRAQLRPTLGSRNGARVVMFGGDVLDGPRHVWWNFVSSSRERIEAAKRAWRSGGFDPVPGETEFIPLPE